MYSNQLEVPNGRLKRFIAEILGFEGWKVVDWWWV